ncbi:MAG TPA: hypothetical protein VES03_01250 [Motilibacterales bacterium]|nr:hypothetical protein [Motilibacterales bacterium]
MPFLLGFLVGRIYYASRAVGKLLTDRQVARKVPWRYIGARLTRDWTLALQMLGIVAIVILWPLGMVFDDPLKTALVMSGVVTWGVSLLVPWIRDTVRDWMQRRSAR